GTISTARLQELTAALHAVPEQVQWILDNQLENIKQVATKYKDARDFLFLGRGYNFPIALEGALKLKEISYIHAEGYPAAEMKHGPIALVDENLPVVFVATQDPFYEKVVSNMQEIKARKGRLIAVVSEGDTMAEQLAEDVLTVPKSDELISPLLAVIPLQLLSYYIGVELQLDVDKPRNLAKSVTVEELMGKIHKKTVADFGYSLVEAPYLSRGESEYRRRFEQQKDDVAYRPLTEAERQILIRNGNYAATLENVLVTEHFLPDMIRNSTFHGLVRIGH